MAKEIEKERDIEIAYRSERIQGILCCQDARGNDQSLTLIFFALKFISHNARYIQASQPGRAADLSGYSCLSKPRKIISAFIKYS